MLASFTARLRRYAGLVRAKPHDVGTAEGRAQERYRRAALTAITGAAARGATIAAALISVPLCIGYLGNERYGLWLTLSSLFAFAYVADLGITAGLQLAISGADARDDRDEARRYVSSAFAILAVTTGIGTVVLAILFHVVDWAAVFNVRSSQAVADAGVSAVVFGGSFLVNILTGVVMRTSYGYQDGYVTHLWQIAGSVLTVVAVVVAVRLDLGLPVLVLALTGLPALALVGNGIHLFGWSRPWLRPALASVERKATVRLLRDGAWYLLAGLSYHAVFLSGTMLIAHLVAADAVPEFGIPFRLAAVITMVFSVIVNSLMPAYTEATTRGDRDWARRALRRSLMISTLLGGIGALGYVVLGRWVIGLWVGDTVHPTHLMLGGLALWAVTTGISNGVNTFVQGTGGVRANGIQWLASAAVAFPTQYLAMEYIGVAGVPWALWFTEIVCRLIPGWLYYRTWLRSTGGPA